MDPNKETREKLTAAHGPLVFATVERLGPVACKPPTEERYLEFVTSVDSSGESTGTAREQLVFDCLVYPETDEEKAKVRRFLEAKPLLSTALSAAIEAKSCGDFDEVKPDKERTAALDAKYEFGWAIIRPAGLDEIELATDSTSGALFRGIMDTKDRGDDVTGQALKAAALTFVRSPTRETIEATLASRPGLLIPIWNRCKRLAGVGAIELGKE